MLNISSKIFKQLKNHLTIIRLRKKYKSVEKIVENGDIDKINEIIHR